MRNLLTRIAAALRGLLPRRARGLAYRDYLPGMYEPPAAPTLPCRPARFYDIPGDDRE